VTLEPGPGLIRPAELLRETREAGTVPRFELSHWRERYGVLAGVTARGAAGQPFDLGLWTAQPVGEVMTRWRALHRLEPGFHATVLANQVHGTDVAWHRDAYGWTMLEGFDGHVTSRAGILLTVTIADCVPVYILDPHQGLVALLHAGWRGTAAGILARGVEVLIAHGGVPDRMVLHCGVGICGACYEVGREVMEGCGLEAPGEGPWHLDLRQVLAGQARSLGIPEVSISEWCSAHDQDHFFSHRRSKGRDGRMVAFLGIRS
jgi:YfiH family protein